MQNAVLPQRFQRMLVAHRHQTFNAIWSWEVVNGQLEEIHS
jgi:hypothetical protein